MPRPMIIILLILVFIVPAIFSGILANKFSTFEKNQIAAMTKLQDELAAMQAKLNELSEAKAETTPDAETVPDHSEEIGQLQEKIAALESAQEANKTAVFANMQAQANNNNTLQRLEHELSGGERGKEKLEQKLAELHAQ